MLIHPASLDAAFVGFNTKYLAGMQAATPQFEEICDVTTDAVGELNYPISEGFPAFRAWPEGKERVWHNLAAHNQGMVPGDFELSVKVPKNKFLDDQYQIFGKDFFAAGMQSRMLWDTLAINALLAGETSVCFDGQEFFDLAHPIRPSDPASATQPNLITSQAFSESNYEESLAVFMGWKAPDGVELSDWLPNELWVGTPNYSAARRFATAETGANGATNIHRDTIKVRCFRGLGTSWCLAKTDTAYKPIALWQREQATMVPLDNVTSEHVKLHREFRYAGEARGVAMLTLPCLIQLNKA